MLIGIAAGSLCFIAVKIKNKLGWDDALDVWGVHGIGGVLGTILLGVFAVEAVGGQAGLIEGNIAFFFKQLVAVSGGAAYAFIFTYIMLMIINLITPVKVSDLIEDEGLDSALHGEKAYDEGAL
jgi:Amt family ammonium transporter